jgi:hypothetical protein
MTNKWVCPHCTGTVKGSGHRCPLALAIEHHRQTCPATPIVSKTS